MTISFEQVTQTRVPGVYGEFDASRAIRGAALKPYKVLLIAQKRSAGTYDDLKLYRLTTLSDAIAGGGAGSMLHGMAAAFFANNRETEAWVIAVDDPAGATATGSFVFTGPATVAGVLVAYVAGRRLQVGIAAAETAAQVATALAAAINADTSLPVTASASSATVTCTARHAGVVGNEIDLRVNYAPGENLPAGLGVTVTPMGGLTAGAGTIDLDDVWPVLGEEQFDVIAATVTDSTNLASLEGELLSRWNALRSIEGIAISCSSGDLSALTTLGASRNSPFVSMLSNYQSPTPSYEVAAAAAGQVAAAGQKDPARPFRTLPLLGVLAPAIADRFIVSERDTLLHNGISTVVVDSGGVVRLERVISTYQKNSLNTADATFLDVTTVLTLGYFRFSLRALFSSRYPRHKLADDDARFGSGQAVITPSIARAEAVALFTQWEQLGLAEGVDQFREDLVVERDASDPTRLNIQLAPDLINGLNVLAFQVQFRL